eukprot:gnl/MRDRNA2_/MRDRNA2_59622_c0_seq1.p1 gnl/MRDRNA2_/MRDRNA2_59622_c0~~gnl/MRDRNA2_/MRDRNA2_59622_c0_seq1.p1  ORF type:complete len:583 (+),score=106.70 gnl/MRDRNA2_/MRDRNA2_59622_c0_seq1:96-1844(+)
MGAAASVSKKQSPAKSADGHVRQTSTTVNSRASASQSQSSTTQRRSASNCFSSSKSQSASSSISPASQHISIQCGRCKTIKEIPCGSEKFTCDKCGAEVRVHLFSAINPVREEVEMHAQSTEAELKEILEEHISVCRRLWEGVMDELVLEEVLWTSQSASQVPVTSEIAQAQALVREAVMSGDTAQLAAALSHAEMHGLSLSSPTLNESLNRLKLEEELEVMWRCLLKALQNRDYSDLELWQREVAARGLQVPEGIDLVVHTLQGEERTRLKQLEYQHRFRERVEDAFRMQDETLLDALAIEARSVGADPGLAEGKLQMLRGNRRTEAGINELRRKSVSELKQELTKLGASADGAVEKEELVQLLAALRETGTSGPTERKPGGSANFAASFPGNPKSAPPSTTPPPRPSPKAGSSRTASKESVNGTWVCTVCKRSNFNFDGVCQVCGTDKDYVSRKSTSSDSHGPRSSTGAQANSRSSQSPQSPRHGRSSTSSTPGAQGSAKSSQSSSNANPPRVASKLTREQALAHLGLGKDATNEEVRKAYKQAALRWHPDRRQNHGNEEEAKKRFQEAKEAFDYFNKPV